MGPAARVGDATAHGGVVAGPGVPNVLIGGMPAAVLGDMQTCPQVTPAGTPHVGGPLIMGSKTVLIGNRPAVRANVDQHVCSGIPVVVLVGAPTVIIGG
jgi:uncharacterized Zn-binding protein involved in type VI secretion